LKNYLTDNFDRTKLANFYDEVPIWSAPFGFKLLEFVNYKPNITALDIGFGAGFPLIELAQCLGPKAKVYGIDPWKEGNERVKQKCEYFGVKNVTTIEGAAEKIPLEDDSIDLIVSNNGLNNVKDIDKVLSECKRVLKPGGQFLATMNGEKTMMEFYNPLKELLEEMGLDNEIELMHKHINEKRKPMQEWVDLFYKAHLDINMFTNDEFCYRFADGTAMFNYSFLRLAFIPEWIKFLPQDKLDFIFDTIEKKLNKEAKEYGEVKLTVPFMLVEATK
jgi:ubiquinone/menaquinone biosynthesis C-methylase UbiE